MEKAKHREQAVSRASAQVTDQVFMRQRDLRKNFFRTDPTGWNMGKRSIT